MIGFAIWYAIGYLGTKYYMKKIFGTLDKVDRVMIIVMSLLGIISVWGTYEAYKQLKKENGD